tara:strand:- start:3647 stop:4081 length:435 start_codon:yes stop_codon:yes gene_type:complete
MSVVGLGDRAVVGELTADHLSIPFVSTGNKVANITFADTGDALKPQGLYLVDTTAGNIAMTLAAGAKQGDVVEIILTHSGGNAFALAVAKLHGAAKTITFGPTSGQYVKLAYISEGATVGWVVLARSSSSDAGVVAVAGMPVIA